ncbi:hypothetical protein [Sphingomonas desiccabilis]|uniref:PAS domain-containing protein n=1 Tax=Sphingomonas desiccabilis TaxID=429134 RepID=A0A4Q2IYZ7_9SPHN|nr:hypothetical protein [Sphingomonas desiccabilis]MBB3909718.1 hypothetical protein [Sphingomonas desiccabilis]RXZ34411.1 hypothetical protein EO081_01590 [Sphingomonas desiccabilis]
MDRARGPDEQPEREEFDRDGVGQGPEPQRMVGGDERRMHVRAYNHWISLLKGRAYPTIEELDPASAGDFGPHGVLLDFSHDDAEPRIRFIGHAVREECGVTSGILRIADVPQNSLLARLTEQYPQILASGAPIGFEAEFVSQRGHPTLYRGILMPFSSDQQRINFIYGVINWKEVADARIQAQLAAEMADARSTDAPPPAPVAPAWADGPGAGLGEPALPDLQSASDLLRTAPALGSIPVDAGTEEFVLLLGRATAGGRVEIIGAVEGSDDLTQEAIRRMHRR